MRCSTSCPTCRGFGYVVRTAVESVGRVVIRTYTYQAECNRARDIELWRAAGEKLIPPQGRRV